MSLPITHKQFNESKEHYKQVLEKAYLKDVANAEDKSYAKTHYAKVYFTENEMIPYTSMLFEEVLYSYNHYLRLCTNTAIEEIQKILPTIRNLAKNHLSNLNKYLSNPEFGIVAPHFNYAKNQYGLSLKELSLQEETALHLTDENIVASVALHSAGEELNIKYAITEAAPIPQSITSLKSGFTRNEQVLALYYLMESLGVNIYHQADRTKMTALFHLIFGSRIKDSKKIKNSNIYKAIANAPYVVNNDKLLIKYLENIRPYFEDANFSDVVAQIDKQIQICKSEISK